MRAISLDGIPTVGIEENGERQPVESTASDVIQRTVYRTNADGSRFEPIGVVGDVTFENNIFRHSTAVPVPTAAVEMSTCAVYRPEDSSLQTCRCGAHLADHTKAQIDAWMASLDMLGRRDR